MTMVKAIIRPEKVDEVLKALMEAGFPAVTKLAVAGRGKQRGIKIGDITYDELPKTLLLVAVPTKDSEFVVETIMNAARTGNGSFGDGKIFLSPLEVVYTVSSGYKEESQPVEA